VKSLLHLKSTQLTSNYSIAQIIIIIMQPISLLLALSSMALVNAAPSVDSRSLVPRQDVDYDKILYVQFWNGGCDVSDPSEPQSQTHYITPIEADGSGKPGDCNLNSNDGWNSVKIRQPSGDDRYKVTLYSGEGCVSDDLILVSVRISKTQSRA
jgi:hypothetical protein